MPELRIKNLFNVRSFFRKQGGYEIYPFDSLELIKALEISFYCRESCELIRLRNLTVPGPVFLV